MNPTDKLLKAAKREGLEWDVYVMANLVAIGFTERDAYCAVINKDSTSPEHYDIAKLRTITKDPAYADTVGRLAKKFTKRQSNENSDDDESSIIGGLDTDDLVDKDAVARELLRMAKSLPLKSKERADIMMKYADLLQMKKDEVKDEEHLVHFYLPISCYSCPLFEAHKAKQRSNKQNTSDSL
jgi:hypothetical protein